MRKEDVKKILGAAKAGGATGGILSAAIFGMVAHGKRRKAERLARETAERNGSEEKS